MTHRTMTRRIGLVLALLAAIGGCAPQPPTATAARCGDADGSPMRVFTLFFGRAVADRGDVTDAEWADFVEHVVTPALPHGFTVFDAEGAWMNPTSRRTIHERTKVLMAALADDAASAAAIGQVRTAYQRAFHQQLVGMTVQPACGSF